MYYEKIKETGKSYLLRSENGIESWVPKTHYIKHHPLSEEDFNRFAENFAKLKSSGSNLIPIGPISARSETGVGFKALWIHRKSKRCDESMKWISFGALVDGCAPEWLLNKIAHDVVYGKGAETNDRDGFEVQMCGLSFFVVDKREA